MSNTITRNHIRRSKPGVVLACMASLTLAVSACGSISGSGGAEEAGDDFYADGETLEIIVPTDPGGGTDTLTRFVAPYLGEELGGVDVVVRNVPGGGTITGINEYVNQVECDGNTLLMSSSSGNMAPMIGLSGIEYGYDDIDPLAAFPVGGLVYSHGEPFATAKDLTEPHQTKQAVYAGQPPSGTSLNTLLAFEMLKTDLNAVLGYEGSSDARLAWMQGEADLRFETAPGYFEDVESLVEAGDAAPLFSFGAVEGDEIVRDPVFPDLPTPMEVHEEVYGQAPDADILEAYKVLAAATITMNKSLGICADAPEQAKQEISDALEAIAANPEFKEAARADLGVTEVLMGEELDAAWENVSTISPESDAMKWLDGWLQETYDINLSQVGD